MTVVILIHAYSISPVYINSPANGEIETKEERERY
jgi:hypothetical protein